MALKAVVRRLDRGPSVSLSALVPNCFEGSAERHTKASDFGLKLARFSSCSFTLSLVHLNKIQVNAILTRAHLSNYLFLWLQFEACRPNLLFWGSLSFVLDSSSVLIWSYSSLIRTLRPICPTSEAFYASFQSLATTCVLSGPCAEAPLAPRGPFSENVARKWGWRTLWWG